MEVQIPSPSVFLKKSPVITPAPTVPAKRPAVAKPKANAPSKAPNNQVQDGAVSKPKQSKSRNGMSCVLSPSCHSAILGKGTEYWSGRLLADPVVVS